MTDFDPIGLFGFMPDEEQMRAITAPPGVNVVRAGPGSGKTSVVVCRILYLIRVLNVKPEDITVLVFNREARAGLAARLKRSGGGLAFRMPEICTVHAKCYRIITANDPNITGVRSSTVEDLERVLSDGSRRIARGDLARIAGVITRTRETMSGDDGLTDPEFGSVREIADRLEAARGGRVSFEDMEVMALRLIEAGAVPKRPHLLVDEAQDLTALQYRIVRGLAGPDLFMVGDSDQCIYAFRYADSRFMDDPGETPGGAAFYGIGTNYRCTGSIVKLATGFIEGLQPSDSRPRLRSAGGDGELPEIRRVSRQKDQFRVVLDRRRQVGAAGDKETVCALYRNNLTGVALVNFLLGKGVRPGFAGSGSGFFEDPAVKRIVAGVRRRTERPGGNRAERPDALVRHICVAEKIIPETTAAALREKMTKTAHFREYRLLLEIAGSCGTAEEFLERLQAIRETMSDKKLPRDPVLSVGTIHSVKGLQFDNVFILDMAEGIFPGTGPDPDEAEKRAEERLMYVAMTRASRRLTMLCPDSIRGMKCRESGFISAVEALLKKGKKTYENDPRSDRGLYKSVLR